MALRDCTRALLSLLNELDGDLGAWERPEPGTGRPVPPPLGRRDAGAITDGHCAVADIDAIQHELMELRRALTDELRKDREIRGARIDAELQPKSGEVA